MNDRIQELVSQAQKSVQFLSNSAESKQSIMMERFAELIIRECTEVSINNGCGDFVDIKQKLFEHFGVTK